MWAAGAFALTPCLLLGWTPTSLRSFFIFPITANSLLLSLFQIAPHPIAAIFVTLWLSPAAPLIKEAFSFFCSSVCRSFSLKQIARMSEFPFLCDHQFLVSVDENRVATTKHSKTLQKCSIFCILEMNKIKSFSLNPHLHKYRIEQTDINSRV